MLEEVGRAARVSPLAQGLLTDRYLNGVPEARATRRSLGEHAEQRNLRSIRGLGAIAAERGQSLAQLALSWVLRDRASPALIGASSVAQLEQNLAALRRRSPRTSCGGSTSCDRPRHRHLAGVAVGGVTRCRRSSGAPEARIRTNLHDPTRARLAWRVAARRTAPPL